MFIKSQTLRVLVVCRNSIIEYVYWSVLIRLHCVKINILIVMSAFIAV